MEVVRPKSQFRLTIVYLVVQVERDHRSAGRMRYGRKKPGSQFY